MYKSLANSLFIGKKIEYVPRCHSTNDLAMQLVKNTDMPEGSVVITNDQYAGRGQRGNTWESSSGKNLTLSVVLNPRWLNLDVQFSLNIITSLAVKEVIHSFLNNIDVKVKWPNDVLVNNKKVAGILIENTIRGGRIDFSVIGIGLNVNQESFTNDIATSLKQLADIEFSLQEIFQRLLTSLESKYLLLKAGKYEDLRLDYLSCLHGYKSHVRLYDEYEFMGEIIDVEKSGSVIISTSSGLKSYEFKEVKFLF